MPESLYITIHHQQMQEKFAAILLSNGFDDEKAKRCAEVFTTNSVEGVYTHGVNRFPRFVEYIQKGYVKPPASPTVQHRFGAIEQWNGNLAPGPLNAIDATERAMQLSSTNGIGCVALANTNHWMRGGYYGWQAAKKGYVFIGWTNTIGIMPTWNAVDSKLGNNPFVIAIPHEDEAIVLDMAMSQFSYGAMELAEMKEENLSVAGGYDSAGSLTNNPTAILQSRRPLPIGYWKGAGLSLLLDLLATILSAGISTSEVSKGNVEYGVSQVFIAIDLSKLSNHSTISATIKTILDDYKSSIPVDGKSEVRYPGERILATRNRNLKEGIPVLKTVWEQVLNL
ncbi:MAG: Malate/L-lactate dehydrogenase [Segetibacter sp.]|nr:Malate/L-lactate dehydrogenase [Segetibacter sp.]